MTRVAALQFASGTDVDTNLATCLRMIDTAQEQPPDVLVLPEFCNHISWYDDADHAWAVAVAPDGPFLAAIAGRAQRHGCYIVINVSLRGDDGGITVTSLCYAPDGQLAGRADKQTLMGHENTWFERAGRTGDVVDAPFGRFAMFPCRDGVTFETPRALALRGVQLFCDSLNSFALDEATLHVPARAPENKVFLVAANKVGPLIPEHLLEAVSAQTHIPLRFLNGAGESQVVAPDGTVLARGPLEGEAVVVADIDLALSDDKRRPDGSGLFAARRPDLYAPLAQQSVGPLCGEATQELVVACIAPGAGARQALAELPALVDALPADTALAVLPELFCYAGSPGADVEADLALGERAIEALTAACAGRPQLHLCASLVRPVGEGQGIATVLVNSAGVVAEQAEVHRRGNHAGNTTDELSLVSLPWSTLAMMTGFDASFPELVKLAALRGAHLLAVPARFTEDWETRYGLPSRAAENRICLVACAAAGDERAGMIADLEREFTIMTEWKERAFDGYINQPLLTPQAEGSGVTVATVHPVAACDKLMSENTDLLLDRPWRLSGDLVRPMEEFADD